MMKNLMMALAAVVLASCASVKIPPEDLQKSEASIRGAEEVGAEAVPTAKLHLQLARDETEQARKMARSGDDNAVLMLARAQSDSELALVLAREATVHTDALAATEDLKAVRARGTP